MAFCCQVCSSSIPITLVIRWKREIERERGRESEKEREVNGKRGGNKRRGGEKKEGRKEGRRSVFTSRLASAKGCRPCLCVLLTRCTSILSACLRKLISIAAETALRNESIDTATAIFSTPPPNGGKPLVNRPTPRKRFSGAATV